MKRSTMYLLTSMEEVDDSGKEPPMPESVSPRITPPCPLGAKLISPKKRAITPKHTGEKQRTAPPNQEAPAATQEKPSEILIGSTTPDGQTDGDSIRTKVPNKLFNKNFDNHETLSEFKEGIKHKEKK